MYQNGKTSDISEQPIFQLEAQCLEVKFSETLSEVSACSFAHRGR